VLAFRRSNGAESLVCLYNLSPQSVRISLTGEAEIVLMQAAERKKDRLTLGPNGFAFLIEPEGQKLQVAYAGRPKRRPQ
jgi:hypothetical protein